MGISPERESPPPSIPPASRSPTIRNAQPMSRAEQIRQQQAQYHREHQQQQMSPPPPQPPPSPSAASIPESSRSPPASPPHQATISEVTEDKLEMATATMPSIDEVVEELSDLQLLEKSTKRLQASFWRPVPDILANKMHRILEGLRVVMEHQEGVYYNH